MAGTLFNNFRFFVYIGYSHLIENFTIVIDIWLHYSPSVVSSFYPTPTPWRLLNTFNTVWRKYVYISQKSKIVEKDPCLNVDLDVSQWTKCQKLHFLSKSARKISLLMDQKIKIYLESPFLTNFWPFRGPKWRAKCPLRGLNLLEFIKTS